MPIVSVVSKGMGSARDWSGAARPLVRHLGVIIGAALTALVLLAPPAQAQSSTFTVEQAIQRAKAAIVDNAPGHHAYCTAKAAGLPAGPSQAAYLIRCETYGTQTEARRACRADAIDNGLTDAARSSFVNACLAGAVAP